MEKHLIISDIDGTLAVDHIHVTQPVQTVLNQLMDAGHEFYVATGRMYNLAEIMARNVGRRAEIIASNGAVYDFGGQRVHHILGEAALKATEMATQVRKLNAVYFSDDAVYYTTTPPKHIEDLLRSFAPKNVPIAVRQVFDLPHLLAHVKEITNGIVFAPHAQDALAQVREELTAKNLLHISASDPTNLELIPQHVDKGVAIAELQKKTGIPAARTIVFGDGLNDLGMLQAADISVAMGNAVPEVKQAANYVTKPNTEDGVASFLTDFFS